MLNEGFSRDAHGENLDKAPGHLEKKYAGGSRVPCSTKTQNWQEKLSNLATSGLLFRQSPEHSEHQPISFSL